MVAASSPSAAPPRWHRWLPRLMGGLNLGLGLVMVAAWHWRITALLQVPPGSPPIRYNTSLALILAGVALLLLQHRRGQRWAWMPAGGVFAIGSLALVQYIFRVDWGIDQWLMTDYITPTLYDPAAGPTGRVLEPVEQLFILVDRPIAGRLSPNIALVVSLAGLALGLAGVPRRWQRWPWERHSADLPPDRALAVAGVLASGVLAVGLMATLGYGAQIGDAPTWRYLTGISIPTALGMGGLGLGIWTHALGRSGPGVPRWVPLSAGFGVLMASLFLWDALQSWGQHVGREIPAMAGEIRAAINPVANIVLIQGVLLAVFIAGLVWVDRRVRAQNQLVQRLNAEQAATNAALESILESTADGILVFDQTMHLLHWNQRFLNLWGIPPALVEDVQGGTGTLNFYAFVMDQLQQPEAFQRGTQAMLAHMDQKMMDVVQLKDGRIFERHARPQWQNGQAVAKVLSYRDVTERYRAEAILRDSEQRYRSLVATLAEGIVLQDADGVVQISNDRAEEILGLGRGQLQGLTSRDPRWRSIHEDGSPFAGDDHPALVALRTGEPCRNVVMGVHKPNGDLTWMVINSQPIFRPGEEKPYAVVTSFADITDRKHMEEMLFYEKELAQVTLHSIGDAVVTTDVEGRVQFINPVAESLTGWSLAEALGQPISEMMNLVQEESRTPVENPIFQALRENTIVELATDTVLLSRDGREIAIDDSAGPIRDRKGRTVGAVMVFHDVTQARRLTRQVFWQAMHDPLTGLVNRRAFEHRLEQAIHNAQIASEVHVLCYLDLDKFKIVNDTCGHKVGDELLRQITALLQTHIRRTDTLARLGGDEFGLLLNQCTLPQGIQVADGLREAVQEFRFTWDTHVFTIGVSIGVVPITSQVQSLETLLVSADSACYAAKNAGRNRVHLFQADDQALAQQQQGDALWANRIARALEQDDFCLFAQPLQPTRPHPHQPSAAEVLIRLTDGEGQIISPMAFLPAAERYGLMVAIDRWVVSTLFKHWHRVQPPDGPRQYFINLSASSLTDDRMLTFLTQQFVDYQVPPPLVCFEITETAAIANLAQARHLIQHLRNLGCHVALDDFGSGMSSFTYLKHLPVNYLKIDGSFVKDMVKDPIDSAMVEAISQISQVMGLKTVAEYVENDDILQRITALGIDFAQGYGIAMPAPLIGGNLIP